MLAEVRRRNIEASIPVVQMQGDGRGAELGVGIGLGRRDALWPHAVFLNMEPKGRGVK